MTEFKTAELLSLQGILSECLTKDKYPVKRPLIKFAKDVDIIVKEHFSKLDSILEKYVTTDDTGKFLLIEGKEKAETTDDYLCDNREGLNKEATGLLNITHEINIEKISKDKSLIIEVDGKNTKITLEDYLDSAIGMSPGAIDFLYEYFID